jgi:hypothetical protein
MHGQIIHEKKKNQASNTEKKDEINGSPTHPSVKLFAPSRYKNNFTVRKGPTSRRVKGRMISRGRQEGKWGARGSRPEHKSNKKIKIPTG